MNSWHGKARSKRKGKAHPLSRSRVRIDRKRESLNTGACTRAKDGGGKREGTLGQVGREQNLRVVTLKNIFLKLCHKSDFHDCPKKKKENFTSALFFKFD